MCSFRLSKVAEDTIKDYFETRLVLLEPLFPLACHRLCEGTDFSLDFYYKPPQNVPEGREEFVVCSEGFVCLKKVEQYV